MEYIALLAFVAALIGVVKPYIPNTKRWHFGIAAFLSFVAVGAFAPPQNSGGNSATAAQPEVDTSAAEKVVNDAANEAFAVVNGADTGKTTEVPDAASKWNYSEKKDEMRGGVSKFAELEAENTIDLDFPYGEQRGLILVRKSTQYGFDILVGVRNGQILCNSFQNTRINVKFDDGPIQKFGCTDASDGTNNMVFISESKLFLSKLKGSKRVIVEAEFFQNGNQQMMFQSENLKWE